MEHAQKGGRESEGGRKRRSRAARVNSRGEREREGDEGKQDNQKRDVIWEVLIKAREAAGDAATYKE